MKNGILILLIAVCCMGCKPQYLKFDKNPPGLIPLVFAHDVIAKNNEYVGYCAFNPDGSELYYAVTNSEWSESYIVRVSSDSLEKKDTLYLEDRLYEGEPFVTKDGQSMYFTVIKPPSPGKMWHSDIYRVNKTSNGWGDPEILDSTINSQASEWHVSLTDNNVMYYTSEKENGTSALHGDIFRAELKNNKFVNVTKLPAPINTDHNDSDPLIAPNESYLIFHSNRPGGYGEHDLYISFNKNGEWTDPENMGKDINTAGWEMAPTLTPDGKYLLFTRREAMVTSKPSQIFWVSTQILEKYR